MMVIHIIIANIFVAIKEIAIKKEIFLNILLIFAFVCFAFADEQEKCLEGCGQQFKDCVNKCEKTICFNYCNQVYNNCMSRCCINFYFYYGYYPYVCQDYKIQKEKKTQYLEQLKNYQNQLEQLQKEQKMREERIQQYQKCLDECEKSYEWGKTACSLGVITGGSYGFLAYPECISRIERERNACYQRCVLRYKY